jgi:hypothetical protein
MTRECDERMWNLAHRLARSGEHRNYQAIEWELQAFGYPQARQLLYHERVRQRLDGTCAEAQKESGIRYSFASEKSALLHVCDLDDGKKSSNPIDKHVGNRVRMLRFMLDMSPDRSG